ncbi:DUF134 domain-containing protein [Patescibacteria group bacterium]|nr:DUF134 domain-containing protein [Patescibacteria group bacterium]
MVRPRLKRRIFFKPEITYFKPRGVPLSDLKEIKINFEELEAIRLIDVESINQIECGKKMNISQSTLSRLLKEGRKKIAEAIIRGNALKIEGGTFDMAVPEISKRISLNRRAEDKKLKFLGRGRMGQSVKGPGGICKCPKCGYEKPQLRAQPCIKEICPKCEVMMERV